MSEVGSGDPATRERDWWAEPSGQPSSALPPPPTSPSGTFRAHPSDLHPRRRGLMDAHLENVMLPPRPTDLPDDNLNSFLDDEAFADDDHKARRLTLSMIFPGVRLTRRSLPTCLLVAGLVFLAFMAGLAVNKRSTGAFNGSTVLRSSDVRDIVSSASSGHADEAPPSDDRPQCGSQYAIQGGSAYGGHNEAFGCIGAG
jgi:hypothetical protein